VSLQRRLRRAVAVGEQNWLMVNERSRRGGIDYLRALVSSLDFFFKVPALRRRCMYAYACYCSRRMYREKKKFFLQVPWVRRWCILAGETRFFFVVVSRGEPRPPSAREQIFLHPVIFFGLSLKTCWWFLHPPGFLDLV